MLPLRNSEAANNSNTAQIFSARDLQIGHRALRNRTISHKLLKELLDTEIRTSLHNGQSLPTINQLAENFYVSPRTLSRRMSSSGINYRDLVAEMKRESAEQLLANTEILVCTIAKRLGYTDKSNFSKAFKNWTGLTPKEFRQAQQEPHPIATEPEATAS